MKRIFPVIFFLTVVSTCIHAQNNHLILNDAFINKYYNRATIATTFTIDIAHKHPNKIGVGSLDGDMHIAGRSNDIGLPCVSEIMNAAQAKTAVDLVHAKEGTDNSISMTGVWRVWFEHPSTSQTQGDPVDKITTTNPDHNMEIHPIVKLENIDLDFTLQPIVDQKTGTEFSYKDAATTIAALNKVKMTVEKPSSTQTELSSNKVGYNYVLFTAKITKTASSISDGHAAVCDIVDGNTTLAKDIRLVTVENTNPDKSLTKANVGDKMDLVGITRVSLYKIHELMADPGSLPKTVVLPYEFVVVAVK